MEVVATALNKGIGKLDVIKESIAPAFCNFVEQYAYVYVRNRNEGITLYKNTIALYNKFKPEVGTIKEQLDLIRIQADKILNR